MSCPKELRDFIDEVVLIIQSELSPDFILLAGSFGKDSWLFSESKLVSDFEFVFVNENRWSVAKKRKLLKNLNSKYSYEINLKGYLLKNISRKIISNYAFSNPGYLSLDFFDTFSNPKILYSKHGGGLDFNLDDSEIPAWEAWRLFVNRLGDFLTLSQGKNGSQVDTDYLWLKIFESIADAYLIANSKYQKSIAERNKIFSNNPFGDDTFLSDECKDSLPIIIRALRARSDHNVSTFSFDQNNNADWKVLLINWKNYFEQKLIISENIMVDNNQGFYSSYLRSYSIQNKYLGFNYRFNTIVSNLIRLIYNKQLIAQRFKIYKLGISWRHYILIAISSTVEEFVQDDVNYPKTKRILSKLIHKSELKNSKNNSFVSLVLKYWKILR